MVLILEPDLELMAGEVSVAAHHVIALEVPGVAPRALGDRAAEQDPAVQGSCGRPNRVAAALPRLADGTADPLALADGVGHEDALHLACRQRYERTADEPERRQGQMLADALGEGVRRGPLDDDRVAVLVD